MSTASSDSNYLVIEALLQLIREDSVPDDHVSSHWQLHSDNIVVNKLGENLILEGSGFGTIYSKRRFLNSVVRSLERISYRSVTKQLRNYPDILSKAKLLRKDLSCDLTYTVWAQVVAVSVLVDHFQEYNLFPNVFALIGDGYGFMGALLKRQFPNSRIYLIDLPKVLIFQAKIHQLSHSGRMQILTGDEKLDRYTDIVLVPPQNAELILDNIDCAVNMASMAEMNQHSITAYFKFLRDHSSDGSRFYCLNRLEKELVGGETNRFYDYPWKTDDSLFIDENCPFSTHVMSMSNSGNGPKILGVRIPFINYLDGEMIHRLVHLSNG